MKKLIVAALIAAMATTAFANVQVGDIAPEISAESWLNTEPLSLADLRGEIVVVEFWATWCGPCRTSIPHLSDLYNRFSEDGVTIIGLTDEDRSAANVDAFARELEMDYPVGTGSPNSWEYGVTGIPTAFVVNQEGVVVWRGHPMGELDSVLEDLVSGDFSANPYEDADSDRARTGVNTGSLSSSDASDGGRYFDSFVINANEGDVLSIAVESSEFDTTLTVIPPAASGEIPTTLFNDDAPSSAGLNRGLDSFIEAEIARSGQVQIVVSSYATGETGSYELSISDSGSDGATVSSADVETVSLGQSRRELTSAGINEGGRYVDVVGVELRGGRVYAVSVESGDFDTTLRVLLPSGSELFNDDGRRENADLENPYDSYITFTPEESGLVTLRISSYSSGDTGQYKLTIEETTAL
mgnify:CR=1 FL=1